jgi:hypothetical protein
LIAAKGPSHVIKLVEHIEDAGNKVPDAARLALRTLVEALRFLSERIDLLDREIARRAREDDEVRRLMSIPGVGPVTAVALAALAPSAGAFRKGRDFAAWVGLTPSQHSTGGKQRLGTTSKMGERTLRRLLIIGASSVVRKAVRQGTAAGSGGLAWRRYHNPGLLERRRVVGVKRCRDEAGRLRGDLDHLVILSSKKPLGARACGPLIAFPPGDVFGWSRRDGAPVAAGGDFGDTVRTEFLGARSKVTATRPCCGWRPLLAGL